jgi:hypothetical protein
VRRGHQVTLFASGDSRTRARLVAPWPRALRADPGPPDPHVLHTLALAQAFSAADEFDVIHCHVDYLAWPYGRLAATPVVHTLHGRLDLRPLADLLAALPDVPLISISDRRLGLPLRIAARVDRADRDSFEHPVDWPEPFGIAMIEALACGTPVIARPYGAVPEVIRDGEVGFLADSLDDFVAAVKRVDLIDRARCRRWVEERFSVGVMADRYEAAYRRVLSSR